HGSHPYPDVRRECAAESHRPVLDATQWATLTWRVVLVDAGARGLGPQFATDFRRTTVPVVLPDGTQAILCLDIGEVRDGRGRASAIAEMEIELQEGAVAALYDFVDALAVDVPLAVETRSKAERGYALPHGDRRQP